jgi:hypothetical protein
MGLNQICQKNENIFISLVVRLNLQVQQTPNPLAQVDPVTAPPLVKHSDLEI